MPAWKLKLNDVQREALAEYVRGFYAGDDRGTARQPR
jgi:hypothetical protein